MRLLELEVKNKGNIIYHVTFYDKDSHCDENSTYYKDPTKGPFSSVIIGANGSGKSRLLTVVAEILSNHFQGKRVISREYDDYTIKCIINGQEIVIKKNQENAVPHFKIFSSSFIINDKFPFSSNNFYAYKGPRQVANAIFSNTIDRQFIANILSLSKDGSKMKNVAKVFEMLGLENKCELSFHMKRYVQKAKIRRTTANALNRNNRKFLTPLSEDDQEFIIDFVDTLTNKDDGKKNFELFSNPNIPFSTTQFAGISSLNNVLYDIKLWKKDGTSFSFSSASSGEKHMLFSMLNLIISAQEESLILIDEPEVSLHPNWQMKYIDTLKNIFSSFNTHFIIATHSHFLVSDLEGESSSVIRLLKEEKTNAITGELIKSNTYGWSPDEILYRVFEVASSRNRFVAEDIANILDYLSDPERTGNIVNMETLAKLESLKKTLNEMDPLKKVVTSILNKLGCKDAF